MPRNEDPDSFSMSFGDHLEDLRRRMLWALAVPLPLAIALFIVSDRFIEWLYHPLDGVLRVLDLPPRLQALGPAEVLVVELKLSLVLAAVLSAPWILWQGWLFVRPGLYRSERRFVRFLVPGSAVLTALGLALMYWVMLPLMLLVLVGVGSSLSLGPPPPSLDARIAAVLEAAPPIEVRAGAPADPRPGDAWLLWPDLDLYVAVKAADSAAVEVIQVPAAGEPIITQQFQLTTYVNFVLVLLLGIVIAFQMPLVILLMGWLGLVTAGQLRARRKYAIFVCAVIAAVITPADAASMIMMFVPLVALFELSLWLLVAVPASKVAEGTIFGRRNILGR